MNEQQPNNSLYGKTLEMILSHLMEHYGWDAMSIESISDALSITQVLSQL